MAKILLVDDDPDILKFGETVLKSQNYEVSLADSAAKALELLNRYTYDMILSDANMPNHSGFDLVKTVKADSKYARVPIAMITGRKTVQDVQRAIDLGVDDYIVKPIDPALLIQKVDSLLQKYSGPSYEEFIFDDTFIPYGTFETGATVKTITYDGLVIDSPTPIKEDSTIRFSSQLFTYIGIESPEVKIIKCTKRKGDKFWTVEMKFWNANSQDLKKVRMWVNARNLERKAAA